MKSPCFAFTFALTLLIPRAIIPQEVPRNLVEPFKFEASYIGDNVNVLSGGIQTGSCYLGLAHFRLYLDTEKTGLWKSGAFVINAANSHGAMPSADLIGDMQVASNIEAGNHTYIQELYYRHTFTQLEFMLGLQDLNVEFANSENGALFLNSSFGILPLISGNITAPVFPLTTLGMTVSWRVTEDASWSNAVYDGCPTQFDHNPYNLNWQFNSGDGMLFISEYKTNTHIYALPGSYRMGGFMHTCLAEGPYDNNSADSLLRSKFGFYAYADQKIWVQSGKSLDAFVQIGYSPVDEVTNDFYIGAGLAYTGLLSIPGQDIIGFAIAHEHFTNGLKSETAVELSYQYHVTANLFIQPDLQYILNPAGTGKTLNNAFTANFRFGLTLK